MSRGKLRVGLVGVGNCASSFVQGIDYYQSASANEPVPGLMHVELGGYHVGDIDIASAFDVNAAKVGRDVAEAIFERPNNTMRFAAPRPTGVRVSRGPTLDGLGKYLREEIDESPEPEVDVTRVLKDSGTEILVNYLPVGSQRAAEFYAERALEAGCAFVNCIPVFIASNEGWRRRFEEKGLPLIGDDIKSQVGATIVHRMLTNLFRERGVRLDRTYQLNFGGNTDFLNMLERERLESKKISKTQAVTSQLDVPLDAGRHPRRAERLCALADRPQVVPHPHGGHDLRRRAAEPGTEARGVGLAQFRRGRDRCGALRQAGARPGHRRRADRAVELFHEVAAAAVHGRRSAAGDAGLHRRTRLRRLPWPQGRSFTSCATPSMTAWERCSSGD